MLRQFLKKRRRILRGFYKTYIRGNWQPIEAVKFWNERPYSQGVSDRQTIARDKDVVTSAYHYASIELLILRALSKSNFRPEGVTVCDLGSGAGHWIDFFLSLGASRCTGIDLSSRAADFLKQKYAGRPEVNIHQGRAADILGTLGEQADVVSAIGVMFHLVDDEDWEATIRQVGAILKPGGLFIVGGHFGWLDNIKVLHYKKLRSRSHWKRSLRDAGFDSVTIQRNNAYLQIHDLLPENNILIARKVS